MVLGPPTYQLDFSLPLPDLSQVSNIDRRYFLLEHTISYYQKSISRFLVEIGTMSKISKNS